MDRKDLSWVVKFGDGTSSWSDGVDGSWNLTEYLEKSYICLSCSAPPLASVAAVGFVEGLNPFCKVKESIPWLDGGDPIFVSLWRREKLRHEHGKRKQKSSALSWVWHSRGVWRMETGMEAGGRETLRCSNDWWLWKLWQVVRQPEGLRWISDECTASVSHGQETLVC